MKTLSTVAWVIGAGCVASAASAATLQVGPGKPYSAPCAAIAAAADGDTIEVDASGSYSGDVCAWSTSGLTIRGVNGRPKIDAGGQSSQGKAIWVIAGDNTVIENIEMTGATVPDQNGAGIRQEGTNLTVRGCYFHDNEDGILAGDKAGSEILIEYTEFGNNGYGDGYSHNLYINHVARLTFRYNYSHDAKIGHLLKSRAAENYVLYNRLTGESGTGSYEIDLPNGGLSYVIGNLIEQGPNTDNPILLTYQEEGANDANPSHQLFVVNNTFVNDRPSGGTFVAIGGSVTDPAVVRNNIFVGPGTVVTQSSAVQEANFQGDPLFANAAGFDYHLQAGSPCVDQGTAPGTGAGLDLTPGYQYVHPASAEGRAAVGAIDIGAYELGGGAGGAAGAGGSGGAGGDTGGAGGDTGGAGGDTGGAGGAAETGGQAGIGGSAGAAGASGPSTAAPATSSGEPSGCACRTSPPFESGLLWLGALGALGVARIRRSTRAIRRLFE